MSVFPVDRISPRARGELLESALTAVPKGVAWGFQQRIERYDLRDSLMRSHKVDVRSGVTIGATDFVPVKNSQ